MALAVRAAQIDERKATVIWLILTMVLGAVFLGVKVVEYADKFEHHHVPGPSFVWPRPEAPRRASTARPAEGAAPRRGHRPADQLQRTTQIYFSLYFAMTGLHALHMIIGHRAADLVAWMAHKGRFDAQYYAPVEMTGLYWHFVDIVWIFLFPLLYLVEGTTLRDSMSGHVSPEQHLLAIFVALMVLTVVTVAVAFVNLGGDNPVVAMGIAIFKATLVVLFFMHVKYSSRLTKLIVVTALFFLGILMFETMMDYVTRGGFGGMPTLPTLQ